MSEDARWLLFRPSDFSTDLHLVYAQIDGLHHIKKVDMRERLGRYIKNANPNKLPNYKMTCKFWEKVILGMENMGDLKMSTSLNDTGDILVRLKPTREYLKKLEQQKETMKYFATEEYEGEEEMEDG